MDISKAFDSPDLDLIEEAGCHYTTPGLDQALVQQHREGQLELQIPGGKERRRVVKRKGVCQGSTSSPLLFTVLMEHHVWRPWSMRAAEINWGGVSIGERQLTGFSWADDNIMFASSAE